MNGKKPRRFVSAMTVDVEDSLLVEHTFSCLFVVVFFLRFSHSDFDRGASAARALYSYQMVGLLRKKIPRETGGRLRI